MKSKIQKQKERDVIINHTAGIPVLDVSSLPYTSWGKKIVDDAEMGGANILFYGRIEGRKKEWVLVGPF